MVDLLSHFSLFKSLVKEKMALKRSSLLFVTIGTELYVLVEGRWVWYVVLVVGGCGGGACGGGG